MAEKKQKVLASEYFNKSALFKADIRAGLDNSATSSHAEYELTCKKCHNVFTRKGNSQCLNICKYCKREWNREDNTITEPEKKKIDGSDVRKSTRVAGKAIVVEIDSSDEADEPVKKTAKKSTKKTEKKVEKKVEKKTSKKPIRDNSDSDDDDDYDDDTSPPHDVEILAKILTGELDPRATHAKPKKFKQEFKDAEHDIEQILDYYDDREDDRWYRFYLVKLRGDDKNTFIRSDEFADDKVVDVYEKNLPTVERFSNVFANTKLSKRTADLRIGYRKKADVEKAMEAEKTAREQLQVDIVYMKAGERYFDLKSKTLFLLEGDKDNDKVMITLI